MELLLIERSPTHFRQPLMFWKYWYISTYNNTVVTTTAKPYANKVALYHDAPIYSVWFVCLRINVLVHNFQSCLDEAIASRVLPVLLGGKYVLLKDTTRRPEWGSNPPPLDPESEMLTTRPPHTLIYNVHVKDNTCTYL